MTREEAKKYLIYPIVSSTKIGEEVQNQIEAYDLAIAALDQPEKKVGRWLWRLSDNGWADHICSECGWTKNTDIHVRLGYRYCPNCGSYNK